MKNSLFKNIISIMLVLSILMSFSCYFIVNAQDKIGYITDDKIRVRTSPSTTPGDKNRLVHNGEYVMLNAGHEVTVLDTVDSPDDTNYPTWQHIEFNYNGVKLEGYVSARYVRVVNTPSGDVVLPEDVPEIYKEYIEKLVVSHPNWKFVFYDTGLEWSSLVSDDAQGDRMKSMIYYTFPLSYRSTESGSYNWKTDTWIASDSGGFYHANDQTILHYMDPRNFLNERNIFMFEALSFDEKTQTIEGVEKILKGSFMENKKITNTSGESVTYAQAYMDAAKISGVSPYHLASRTIQEVGVSGSGSTSGTFSGYAGYYNYYNIMAYSGSNPIASGLKYASGSGVSTAEKNKYMLPWNSPYKAIVGGAKWIGNGYINNNQDTLYYQKFNVVNKNWNHQYMANITAPATESVSIMNTYSKLGIIDNAFTFIIPYYRNMPKEATPLPEASNANPNNWLKTLKIDNYTIDFDPAKTSGYSIEIPSSVSKIKISATTVNSKATVKGTGEVSLNKGINHIKIDVTAENGSVRTYTIEVVRGDANSIPLNSISLNKTSLDMIVDDTYQLSVNYNPTDTTDDKTVVWSSSDESVVRVVNGKLTAVGKGEATITARVGSYTATCKVTVKDKFVVGDVNMDGKISAIDARYVLQHVAETRVLTEEQIKYSDINNDGKITAIDARGILKIASQA